MAVGWRSCGRAFFAGALLLFPLAQAATPPLPVGPLGPEGIDTIVNVLGGLQGAELKDVAEKAGESPLERFAAAYAEMRRGAVLRGQQAEEGLWSLYAEVTSRADGAHLTAHLLLAIGIGQGDRGHCRQALETLERAVSAMRASGDDQGLALALRAFASALVDRSRRPWDALGPIQELSIIAARLRSSELEAAARELLDRWRHQMNAIDDYFGRARHRLQAFPRSLGIPEDSDLVALRNGVLLMNGDTDDQNPKAAPEFTTLDGVFVRTMKLPDPSLELRGSLVDSLGRLWAATQRGLFLYRAGSFTQLVNRKLGDERGVELIARVGSPLPATEVREVALPSNLIDEVKEGPDGRLYLATGRGPVALDPDRLEVELFPLVGQDGAPQPVERIAPLPDGSLVVAWRDAYAVRPRGGAFERHPFRLPQGGNNLFGLQVDRTGNAWVHGVGGALELSTGRIVDGRLSPSLRNVNHVLLARDGAAWFATPDGLCRLSDQHCAMLDDERGLPTDWVLDLLERPEGGVFASLYLGGLLLLLPPHYEHFGPEDGLKQPVNPSLVKLKGDLYLMNNTGLSRISADGTIDNFTAGADLPEFGVESFLCPLSTDELAMFGSGFDSQKSLVLFDGRKTTVLGRDVGLPDEPILAVCEMELGVLLVAVPTGVFRLDALSRNVRRVTELDPLLPDRVAGLACRPGQPVWALTAGRKLYRLSEGRLSALTGGDLGILGNPLHLFSGPTIELAVLGEHEIAFLREGRFDVLTLEPGVHPDAVERDPQGRLYFATDTGLFATDSEAWVRLGVEDGLVSDVALDVLADSEALWVSGKGGVARWRWPERVPPETFLVVRGAAHFRDPAGRDRRLRVSDGIEKPQNTILRSMAGVFEAGDAEREEFWPPAVLPKAAGEERERCDPEPHRSSSLAIELRAADPWMADGEEAFSYRLRLDRGPWRRAAPGSNVLTDLVDGDHLLEVRATDRRLNADATSARYCFRVETPISPALVTAAFGLLAFALFLNRGRIVFAVERLRHRRFKPIAPSPFTPNRPAEGAGYVGREALEASIENLRRRGGVTLLVGNPGVGKHSLMRRLAHRFKGAVVVALDLAEVVTDADPLALVKAMSDGLQNAFGALGETDLLADLHSESGDFQESMSNSVQRVSLQSITPSLAPGEGNPFGTLAAELRKLEHSRPGISVVFLLDNAEVLGFVKEDSSLGNFLFPFLRSQLQQRTNLVVVLAVEGRAIDLRRRFESLLAFSAVLPVEPLSDGDVRALVGQLLRGQALVGERELAHFSTLTGGHPKLVQDLGDRLVAELNARRTNVVSSAALEAAAQGLVIAAGPWFQSIWAALRREERLLLVALATEGPRTLALLTAQLEAKKVALLPQEAQVARRSLLDEGLLQRDSADGLHIRSELFSLWIQRHQTVAGVLEESQDYVSHYKLQDRLGEGGIGVVYRARDMVTGNTVALKLLRPQLSEDRRNRRRFLREAKLLRRLDHPGIVRLLDYGEQAGRLFLTMELIEGRTLRSAIAAGPLPPGLAATLGLRLCSALSAIHSVGIVHRDVKSDNVMLKGDLSRALEPGGLKLMDFGLAIGQEMSRVTRAGSLVGTIAYMAPEQARGDPIDQRADLYSLGVMLFEMLTGSLPFEGTEATVLNAVLHELAPPLISRRPDCPAELALLVDSLLARDPAERPMTATQVESLLEPHANRTGLEAGGNGEIPVLSRALGPMNKSFESVRSKTLDVLRQGVLQSFISPESSWSSPSLRDRNQGLIYWVAARVARQPLDQVLLAEVLEQALVALAARVGAIARSQGDRFEILAASGIPEGAALSPEIEDKLRTCAEQQTGLVITNTSDPTSDPRLAAPLWGGDRVLGAILLEREPQAEPFTDDDLELLACIGYLLGLGMERERLFEESLRRERMAAVGQMLAGVAHDLRNPMTVISGFAMLLEGSDEARVIVEQVEQMEGMIHDLLAYMSGNRELATDRVDPVRLGEQVKLVLERQAHDRRVDIDLRASGRFVVVDESRVRRILLNLGKNSIDALKRGGKLTIEITGAEDGLNLVVQDDGPGILPEVRARLFEPFVTAGKRGGTGLGLAVVKAFVDDHGGRVSVESAALQGTTFRVFLPEIKNAPEGEAQSGLLPASPSSEGTAAPDDSSPADRIDGAK